MPTSSPRIRSVNLLVLLLLLAFGLAIGLAPGFARAAQPDLYSGEAPVADTGDAERKRAVPLAFVQVLRKQSGLRELPAGPDLDAQLAAANSHLVTFQYREYLREMPGGVQQPELRLVARFAPAAVEAAVRALALQRWRPERQPVVLWLLIDDGQTRTLQPEEYRLEWAGLTDQAEQRGLQLAWPELSEELKQALDLQLLWSGYTEQLQNPGSASDGVAIVAARRDGAEWNLNWTFSDYRAENLWQTRNPDLALALTEGLDLLVDQVALASAISPAEAGSFETSLRLTDLTGSEDYARAINYLGKLSLVERVRVDGAGPDGLRLRLELNADPRYLTEMLLRDRVLAPLEQGDGWRLAN